ncbi:Cytochrome P450 2C21 [Pseudolycoriella hygida]|uniref:Cytochrome P450 2C21 n=1 Tax=Pseudolycoriella hygida TaxID=35572 RepID=A0A9Q0S342_9DIPT|nr:Cytochrome P450 2C21 [Pseudolycoriella hygida]
MIVFIVTLTMAFLLWVILDNSNRRKSPPGPLKIPIFGNALQISLADNFTGPAYYKLAKKYGDVMSLKTGTMDSIVLSSYEVIRELFSKDELSDRQCDGPGMDRNMNRNMGVIFSSGKIWRDLRRFTLRNLRDFGFSKTNLMENAQQDELQYFKDFVKEKLKKSEDGVVSMDGFFNLSVLNIVWGMIMSERFPYDDPKLKHYIRLNDEFFLSNNFVSSWSLYFPFLRSWFPEQSGRNAVLRSVAGLQDFIRGLIQDCRRKEIYKVNPQNLVDVFLEKIESERNDPNTSFDDDQLLITMLDVFQAGIETTSNILSWTILFLILNPDVQAKLYEEISRMIPKGEQITLDYKNRMPYTHATILEAHRRAQIIPIAIAHKVVSDFVYRGYLFKAGTPVFANTYAVLMNEKMWPNPDKFSPERFIDASGNIDKKKAEIVKIVFLPGKRVCIGESVAESTFFMYLVGLVQTFQFQCVPGKPKPTTEPQVGFAYSPHPFDVLIKVRDN